MSEKRESEDTLSLNDEKRPKLQEKKDEIAIDSELLGQQSSYPNDDNLDPANAAAAALSTQHQHQQQQQPQQQHLHNQHQEHDQDQQQHQQQQQQQQHAAAQLQHQQHQQQQQHLAYQAAAGKHQQGSPQPSLPGLPAHIQPTTLPHVPQSSKPQHGSDEWHKLRRENHKEVERRRREAINQGIKELAALIPTPDPNKAQILQRAVEFIKRLKENESNNIEKWTLEKLLTDQAVAELSASNEKLKQELERAYREIEQWKNMVNKDEKKQ